MAYATLLSLTQSLEQILHPDDQSLILPETEQQIMRSLSEKVSFFLSFLENDSLKYGESSLEPRIRDAAYEAETMIESSFPYQNQHDNVKKIVKELDSIMADVVKMNERNQVKDLPQPKSLPSASTESDSTNQNLIVGLRKEMMEIKDRLIGSPSRREIISIVGMPGIGKTTLAKTLYDDPVIVKHFDVRAWVTVSHEYHLQQILTGILDSIQKQNDKSYPEDLATHLHKTLKRQRYLIVMDDIWETNALDRVKRFFPEDNNGSRVILTTRLQDVAVHVDCPDSIYRPSLLSIDDSWKLLCQKAFGTEHYPPEFEGVGKEIANNCKGLPLSLAVIGGILNNSMSTLDYWRFVAQNVNSALNDKHDQVMNILSLSYKHLPHHLRACFLYMRVFPEDHEISKSKLIRLWVGEGFIKPTRSKSLEDVAHEYLQNLIDRNMIFIRERNRAGGIKMCGIHDLMRDLCKRIGLEEKFLNIVYSQPETPSKDTYHFRHVYIHSVSQNLLVGIYGLLANFPNESPNTNLSPHVFGAHLRVLDGEESPLSQFEDELVNLVGLKYISFRCDGENYELPSSISKLLNLQTLVIKSWDKVMLPSEIWMMPRLRHIKTRECLLPCPFDAENGGKFLPLRNLQTLKGVTNFRFSEDAIRMMPNLKKLGIKFCLDGSKDLTSYYIGNLVLLHQLEALNVVFIDKSHRKYRYPPPKNFSLPPKLRKLALSGFRLSPKHMAVIGSLQYLEVLKLISVSFDGSQWEATEGEFLQLKSLVIHESDLEYLIADETNFPNLQSLRIIKCSSLMEIPSRIGDIATLRLITVKDCKTSLMDSVNLIEKEQRDLGNDRLQIIDLSPLSDVLRIDLSPLSDVLRMLILQARDGSKWELDYAIVRGRIWVSIELFSNCHRP